MEDFCENLLATSIRMYTLYNTVLSLCSVKRLDKLIEKLFPQCITAMDVETACLLCRDSTLHTRGLEFGSLDKEYLSGQSWYVSDQCIHDTLPNGTPFLASPIQKETGPLETLIVANKEVSDFEKADFEQMQNLATITATALESIYEYEDLLQRTESLEEHTQRLRGQMLEQERRARKIFEVKNAQLQRQTEGLEVRNRFIREPFGRYLTDEVVENLLASPSGLDVGGEKRKVTILISDLRGFSSVAEGLPPGKVVSLLNTYLETITDVIMRYDGTIDEFIGDAILVIFGAPIWKADHAKRAVACALEMQLAMGTVNAQNRRAGLPGVEMGIGINTGEVVVGNIGSLKHAKYSVVGSHGTLASRIESYTVGEQILISDETLKEARLLVRISRQMQVEPKGVKEPITIYEVEGIGGEHNLYLPEVESELFALDEEIPIRYMVLEEKFAGRTIFEKNCVKLSTKEAEVRSEHPVSPLGNLKIQLIGNNGEVVPGNLFGKVVGKAADCQHHFYLRFTSVPSEVAAFLYEHLIRNASIR